MLGPIFVTALAIGAPAIKESPKREDSLGGEWVLENATFNGKRLSEPRERDLRFGPDGRGSIGNAGDGTKPDFVYEADVRSNPPAIDLLFYPDGSRDKRRGIFKVEGDTLTVCLESDGGEGRPTTFDAPEGTRRLLYVLKRPKKGKGAAAEPARAPDRGGK
jgi:uncharacterized protein (TIGR03067 family)